MGKQFYFTLSISFCVLLLLMSHRKGGDNQSSSSSASAATAAARDDVMNGVRLVGNFHMRRPEDFIGQDTVSDLFTLIAVSFALGCMFLKYRTLGWASVFCALVSFTNSKRESTEKPNYTVFM